MKKEEILQNIDKDWDRFMIALWGWASHYTEYWKERPGASAPFYSENVIKRGIKNMVFTGKIDDEDITFDTLVEYGQEFFESLTIKKIRLKKLKDER